jgi:hypothetical protein
MRLMRVRSECPDYALANRERVGIWGGRTKRGRRKVQRQRVVALTREKADGRDSRGSGTALGGRREASSVTRGP